MRGLFSIVVLLVSVVACAGPDPEEAPPALTMADVERLGIERGLVPAPGLVTGGQLTREQMVELTALGYDTFVCLRPATEPEAGWEEDFAPGVGATFVRIPMAGPEDVSVANAQALADVLQDADERGVVVYCASGNRVGALFAMRAHFLQGVGAAEALELGRAAGLTRLEPVVQEKLGLSSPD